MRSLFILFSTVMVLVANAQFIHINSDYSLNLTAIDHNGKFPNTVDITLPAGQTMSAKEISAFSRDLLVYLKETRNNLLDSDSLLLQRDYEALWPGFYNQYLQQTQELINFLEGRRSSGTFIYVPDPSAIQQFWNTLTMARKEISPLSNEYLKEYHIYKPNPFNYWLHERIKENLYTADYPFKEMNIEYKQAWRQIEYWYDILPKEIARWVILSNTTYSIEMFQKEYAKMQRMKEDFSSNVVRKFIEEDDRVRKLLWFNGGFMHMNPLLVTDRKYPITEKNTFIKPSFYNLMDSLEKKGYLTGLLTTEKLGNQIAFPLKQPSNDPKQKTLVLHYDANANYSPLRPPQNFEYKTSKLIILIHNLPKDKKTQLKVLGKEVPDQSRAITAANEVFSRIGEVAKLLSPYAATAASITNVLGGQNPAVTGGISAPTIKFVQIEFSPDTIAADVKYYRKALQVGNKTILLSEVSNVDKKDILIESLFTYEHQPDTYMTAIIDKYVTEKNSKPFNYENPRSAADLLIADFRNYLNQLLIAEMNALKKMYSKVVALVRISNRSLPPSEFETTADKAAELRTEIKEEPLLTGTAKVEYTIIESDKADKITRKVASHAFKQAKKTWWDISAGLSYTFFNSYNLTTSLLNGLPQIKSANHFQFMAAFHVYPTGITKLKDKPFKEGWERFSFFAGVSFNKPLDNYFTGGSYDIVPGIKVMGGVHFHRNTNYKIVNDKVIDQASALKFMGPFISANIETKTIGHILGIF